MKKCAKIALAVFFILQTFSSQAQTIPQPTGELVPLLRYFNRGSFKHIYTTNPNEFGTASPPNFVYEGLVGWMRKVSPNTSTFLYRYRNSSTGAYLLSGQTPNIPGFIFEGPYADSNFIPYGNVAQVYQYYNNTLKDYVFTVNPGAENLTGWTNQGPAFVVIKLEGYWYIN